MAQNYHVCFAGANPTAGSLNELESATQAIAENPRNASLTIPIGSDHSQVVPPTGAPSLAMYLGKFWSTGRQLKISFLSGSDWQKGKVKQYAPIWCQYADLSMAFVDNGSCDIMVDFNPTLGSWSHYGTDSGYFANQRQQSMNLGWIIKDQPARNLRQVILHEFGHALGAIHEHESPFASIPWNKAEVYKDLGGPPNNWSHDQVDQNLFTLYGLDMVEATAFDGKSIMLYQLPSCVDSEWSRNLFQYRPVRWG